VNPLFVDNATRRRLETIEQVADDQADFSELLPLAREMAELSQGIPHEHDGRSTAGVHRLVYWAADLNATFAALQTIRQARDFGLLSEAVICAQLREIFGNPIARPGVGKSLGTTVTDLAAALYRGEECAFALHDALLEAAEPELAGHFQQPKHPKGCWAIDALVHRQDMGSTTLSVPKLLSRASTAPGWQVAVRGFIVNALGDETSWLAPSLDARVDRERCILLDSPGLAAWLIATVPPILVGDYIYSHNAVVLGTAGDTDSEFLLALHDLRAVQVSTAMQRFTLSM
jgi:hypothetical protein